jgi:hypothetical protein
MPNILSKDKIPVMNWNLEPLAPVSQAKARLLLKKRKAKVLSNHPYTLRLNYVKDISIRDKEIIKNIKGDSN